MYCIHRLLADGKKHAKELLKVQSEVHKLKEKNQELETKLRAAGMSGEVTSEELKKAVNLVKADLGFGDRMVEGNTCLLH